MQKLQKKGEIGLNQLVGLIVIILVAGIMLTVGLRVDDELQKSVDTKTTTSTLTNGTTLTVVNTTGAYPGIWSPYMRNCALTVTFATNSSGTSSGIQEIGSGNYTVTGCLLAFTSLESDDADAYNNTKWNVTGSMTWAYDTIEYNATGDVKEGKINVSENMGLLGTVIIFGIIISVVVVAFMIGKT